VHIFNNFTLGSMPLLNGDFMEGCKPGIEIGSRFKPIIKGKATILEIVMQPGVYRLRY
jgi:hypothetical protein